MLSPLKLCAFFALLLTAACGFSPMYGGSAGSHGVNATAGLNNVEIALIPDQSGVYLRNILIDDFYQDGYPASAEYRLEVSKITETQNDLDITIESEATRKQIRLSVTMNLRDKKNGEIVVTRPLFVITSYNILGTQFTTRVTEDDAREAGLAELARQIEMHTALYFKR